MSKATRKYQVSIPKALAELAGAPRTGLPLSERLRLFDAATARQAARQRAGRLLAGKGRGWRRENLYSR